MLLRLREDATMPQSSRNYLAVQVDSCHVSNLLKDIFHLCATRSSTGSNAEVVLRKQFHEKWQLCKLNRTNVKHPNERCP